MACGMPAQCLDPVYREEEGQAADRGLGLAWGKCCARDGRGNYGLGGW